MPVLLVQGCWVSELQLSGLHTSILPKSSSQLMIYFIFTNYHRLHGFQCMILSARTFAISFFFYLDYDMGKSLENCTKTTLFIPFLNSSLQTNGPY